MYSVDVYLDKKNIKIFVGSIYRLGEKLAFRYGQKYLDRKVKLSLGPELPFSRDVYISDKLWPSLVDRIPVRENPMYAEYCKKEGISIKEKDEIVLLGTIGKRGPSSFEFVLIEEKNVATLVKEFREKLGLSRREFAALFDTKEISLRMVESGHNKNGELAKRLLLYVEFRNVAEKTIRNNSRKVKEEVSLRALDNINLLSFQMHK